MKINGMEQIRADYLAGGGISAASAAAMNAACDAALARRGIRVVCVNDGVSFGRGRRKTPRHAVNPIADTETETERIQRLERQENDETRMTNDDNQDLRLRRKNSAQRLGSYV